ncbi:MAG: hypothetical protein HQ556_02870 [Candidatus Marinimicrobia bacterium]|nr:hypothetical protein [Candidatus Neomarinimicrobiota bacterium]
MKKMKVIKSNLLTLCAIILLGCSEVENHQEYYFELEYSNWAWGYQLTGWYIDSGGKIYSYSFGQTDEEWEPNQIDQQSSDELRAKYSHSNSYEKLVPVDTLEHYFSLVNTALEGSFSDTTSQGADMGIISYLCYRYDVESETYLRNVLKVTGDIHFERKTDDAQRLISWLEGL